jgi:hypothetical protein
MKAPILTCPMSKGSEFVNKFDSCANEYWDVVACGLIGKVQTF